MDEVTFEEFNPNGSTGPNTHDLFYHEYITGPQGARYNLLREKHHYDEDIEKAKRYLKENFDVVKIYIFYEKT